MAPVIGISAGYTPPKDPPTDRFGQVVVGESYIQAVVQAGGIPLVLPPFLNDGDLAEVFARLDGILLTGGGDIDPALFQGLPHPRVYDINPRRDSLEIGLARLAAGQKKPFLGICRGIQVINVALGGGLYTDIGDQHTGALRHDWYPNIPRNTLAHTVQVEPGSRLAQVLGGESFEVNSLHHQGLSTIAPSLRVVAKAPDQIVEGVELPDHPFGIGVQWHPEWLQEHEPQRELFQALIQASANHR